MNELQVFSNQQFGQVRTVNGDRGEPLFAATDVARALGYTNPHKAVGDHCRGLTKREVIDSIGRLQETNFITEGDVYRLIIRSQLPDAQRFERWLMDEVLPDIRRHGMYATGATIEAMLGNPDTMIRLLSEYKKEKERRAALEHKALLDAPKVLFADSVAASRQSILIGELAKLLKQNGVAVGQNRLFAWMRRDGYLLQSGESRNMPTQRSMEAGWMEIKERTVVNPDGSIRLTKTPKVTGRGQQYFINRYLNQ